MIPSVENVLAVGTSVRGRIHGLSSRSKQSQNEEILMRLPKRLSQSERKEVRNEELRS